MKPEQQTCFFARSRSKVTLNMKFNADPSYKAKGLPICVFYEFLTAAGGRQYHHSMIAGVSPEPYGLGSRIAEKGNEIRS